MNYEDSLNIGFVFIDEDDLEREFVKLVEIKTGLKHVKTLKDVFNDNTTYDFYFRPVDDSVLEISRYYLKEKLSDCLCGFHYNCENKCFDIKIKMQPVILYKNIANLLN